MAQTSSPTPRPKKRVPWADHVLNGQNRRTVASRMGAEPPRRKHRRHKRHGGK